MRIAAIDAIDTVGRHLHLLVQNHPRAAQQAIGKLFVQLRAVGHQNAVVALAQHDRPLEHQLALGAVIGDLGGRQALGAKKGLDIALGHQDIAPLDADAIGHQNGILGGGIHSIGWGSLGQAGLCQSPPLGRYQGAEKRQHQGQGWGQEKRPKLWHYASS